LSVAPDATVQDDWEGYRERSDTILSHKGKRDRAVAIVTDRQILEAEAILAVVARPAVTTIAAWCARRAR
jgi:hypothetical protein